MTRWLVLYYDGFDNKAVFVEDNNGALPYGAAHVAEPELSKTLGKEVSILCVIDAEGIGAKVLVVIDDQDAEVPTVQL